MQANQTPKPPKSWWTPPKIVAVSVLGVGALVAASLIGNMRKASQRRDDIETCLRRGRAVYEAMGSWPTFSDGRDAAAATRDHCQRDPHTFDGAAIDP